MTLILQIVDWPWVKFYSKKRGSWTESTEAHTLLHDDVLKNIDPPDIMMRGLKAVGVWMYTCIFLILMHINMIHTLVFINY